MTHKKKFHISKTVGKLTGTVPMSTWYPPTL